MVFNSLEFALFFPIVLVLYIGIYRRENARDLCLVAASYIFYMCWFWQYAGLIAVSTLLDYFVGKRLAVTTDSKARKLLLLLSVGTNLGILAFFKYFNFFAELSTETALFFGISVDPFVHQFLLPVGISFYTFQTLSYTIDVYRRQIPTEPSLIKFAVFVSFFPQLVAGPIVRAKDFLPQINRIVIPDREKIQTGLALIFIGLFKKIVIADQLALLAVDSAFDNPAAYSSFDLLMALYAYAFQIYCDFSGYSDIAIGVALTLGFRLPANFNRPYLSQSPSEFWLRWHISLSSWLRDYLYISLGGNRFGSLLTYRNLFITMLLGGLWHGAAMNFIIWGAFHGALLIIWRLGLDRALAPIAAPLRIALFFHLTLFGWLLFRVTSMDNFMIYVETLLQFTATNSWNPLFYAILGTAACMHFVPRALNYERGFKLLVNAGDFVKAPIYVALLLLFAGMSVSVPNFIYFQF